MCGLGARLVAERAATTRTIAAGAVVKNGCQKRIPAQ